MDFPLQIAIPSYKRAQALVSKTLAFLQAAGVPDANITVFCAPDDVYQGLSCHVINTHVKGIAPTRNFIYAHYSPGTRVLCMDDDIEQVYLALSPKRTCELPEFTAFVSNCFVACAARGIALWGIYPVLNPYFMHPAVSMDLRFICGVFHGIIIPPDVNLRTVHVAVKEDYELTLKHFNAYGAVMRVNGVAVKTRYYKNAGGCQEYRDTEVSSAAAATLLREYPHQVRAHKRKSGHAEISLVPMREQRWITPVLQEELCKLK